MKRVKFTASGSNAEMGLFERGDVANLSDEMAKHLVENMGSAQYEKGGKEGPSDLPQTQGPVHSTPESRLALRKERFAESQARAAVRPRNQRSVSTSRDEVSRGSEPLASERSKK